MRQSVYMENNVKCHVMSVSIYIPANLIQRPSITQQPDRTWTTRLYSKFQFAFMHCGCRTSVSNDRTEAKFMTFETWSGQFVLKPAMRERS